MKGPARKLHPLLSGDATIGAGVLHALAAHGTSGLMVQLRGRRGVHLRVVGYQGNVAGVALAFEALSLSNGAK